MPWIDEVIETDRLRLRAPGPDDRDIVAALMGDDDVRRYLGGALSPDQLAEIDASGFGHRWGAFLVDTVTKNSEQATVTTIGSVSFGRERDELEVSYEMMPSSWGSGFATEAVGAAIEWAWSTTDDASIIAVTQSANERSCRLLARLGFEEEARFEEFGAEQAQFRLHRPG